MSPAGLHNSVVDALMKASPEVIFLAFGRRSILSSTTMWQSILYPPIFVRIIDMSLLFLFNWTGRNISAHQKLAAYPHLYSFTSTKSVVHWFQIIRNKSFQMYDDDVQAPLSLGASDRYYKVAKFPTRNIKTPIVLIYGGSDSLVDINVMLQELPKHTVAKEVPHFEHLDFLWAQQVETLVFPYVFSALEDFAGRDHQKENQYAFKSTGNGHLATPQLLSNSEDEISSPSDLSPEVNMSQAKKREGATRRESNRPARIGSFRNRDFISSSTLSPTYQTLASMHGAGEETTLTNPIRLAGDTYNHYKHQRSGSLSSAKSLDLGKRFGERGISVGTSKPIVGQISSRSLSRPSDANTHSS